MESVMASSKGIHSWPRRDGLRWVGSWISALGVTVMLFSFIPSFLHPDPVPPSIAFPVTPVDMIRIPRPDTPLHREIPKPAVMEPEKPKPLPESDARQLFDSKLKLPFDINPKLPGGPVALEFPASMATVVPNDFGLPNVFSAGDLDQPLITLSRMPPIYPFNAKQRHIQGWVRVRFIVTVQGTVKDVAIVEAQPAGVFEQSVRRCVCGWRFRPGTVEGVPVNTWAETTVKFELKNS
jgi:protein TonB